MKLNQKKDVNYSLNGEGSFVINNYNESKPFSNFFPGIAGLIGIPMWVFYINRGQCIASFGIETKDKAIMEFQPANKSYQQTSLNGFRTFVKAKQGSKTHYWEPFQQHIKGADYKKTQTMRFSSHDLIIEEENKTLGLKACVRYFTLPQEPYSALVRHVTIKNTSQKNYQIELIDGLPSIVAYGLRDELNKNISRTAEAWVKVRNLNKQAPFYQLNVEIDDKPEVVHITEGNFFFSIDMDSKDKKVLKPIVETSVVFDQALDFSAPAGFLKSNFKIPQKQQTSNRTPSALCHHKFSLGAKKERNFASLIGYARDVNQLNKIVRHARSKDYIVKKEIENKAIIDDIKNFAFTQSASKEFDLYCGATFLDNILRGGHPISLKTSEGNVAFNVYSRKHGDLERDYNYFFLASTFYSQGNGNYRDVNQNRRNDVWFNTDVADNHLIGFLNLIQADGYNPLVVKGVSFAASNKRKAEAIVNRCVQAKSRRKIAQFVREGFMPGDLLKFIDDHDIKLKVKPWDFLGQILEVCQKKELADHGEGFWTDHWTYNTDLIESYLSVYPEERKNLFLKKKVFSFYHNNHYVKPRKERYILTDRGVRQYHNVGKLEGGLSVFNHGSRLRIDNGKGRIYQTNLICKLLCLIANKAATLDPSGIGVEMEADKPNWYDSLNGLPGLMGSSVSETFEVTRLSQLLLDSINQLSLDDNDTIEIFNELAGFIAELMMVLKKENTPLNYWKKSNDAKERYRTHIRIGLSGRERTIRVSNIKEFLKCVIDRTAKGAKKAKTSDGFLATYFYHDITDYRVIKNGGGSYTYVQPLKFRKYTLPLFLEGYVHAFRTGKDAKNLKTLYQNIKRSKLYDKKLKMYKVCADLSGESEEIGRTRIFPASWLENESIWLHMEYKFFLELLRSELYDEFYDNFKSAFVPFLKPETYGRSILENSSFIVSSAHEDPSLHGQGFVARLSGSTAEFMHMWLLMNLGKNPFSINEDGELNLEFKPALPGWLFAKKTNTYSFNLFGATKVVYHNPQRKNTFGKNCARIKSIRLDYAHRRQPVIIYHNIISQPYAQDIRDGKVKQINVLFS